MDEKRPVSISDVARLAGVAISSVSRALTDHPDVSPAMKAKVQSAVDELGYSPDPGAQSLRSGFTRTVGFVVRDFANPVFADIVQGVEDRLNQAGYTLLLTNSGGDPAREVDRLELLRQRRVDALMMSSIAEGSISTNKAIRRLERPVVLLDREGRNLRAGSVLLDHAVGVRDATTDLLRLHHERIAIITGSTAIRPTRQRVLGYQVAHEAMGFPTDPELEITGAFSAPFAREATMMLLDQPAKTRPSAIIAGGVQTTIGVLEALTELGIRPGQDLSLVVCDDLPWLRVFRPRVSVVLRDANAMGRAAAELALELIRGGKPRSITLPTTYEVRETSRSPAPGEYLEA